MILKLRIFSENAKPLESLKCYSCLGRDFESCEIGTVTCDGSCFKLIDKGKFKTGIIRLMDP